MLRRAATFFLPIVLFGCTSTQEQLGQVSDRCDYDEQCATPLVCRCVLYGQPDPEGNLEILGHGYCERSSFNNNDCPNDGGADTSPVDTGGAPDSGADSGLDSDDAGDASEAGGG